MTADPFDAFLASGDTLRIYQDGRLLFSSKKDRLLPLMEYIANCEIGREPVAIFDKIMGNAAALLAVKANAGEVASPMGSELAVRTLDSNGIRHRLTEIVPYILRPDGQGLCPMEELSMGKGPEDFYREMKRRIGKSAI
ncbi:MAG: hypothetical protein A2Z29_01310 [Chloroflexi bacterium RBG_16_56_11]|nr:MAG: hypothetical protein A2Z29_01310 [Chloroflexi bacterium RBG_16_56_11]